ncbi:hypothetical protein N7466_009701 [Penicillium verhagenii]|uniref:uncharacterized protein n=1 Tax=Penicillium verhagenii TaxID=1562060 RepID=UPI0025452274|nr:uncharacterized protein N7466_009701 [Penicillium verhagenii]KAJ5921375.1 hypothetical protein N7466_009701 [Penicillium verhagenii]
MRMDDFTSLVTFLDEFMRLHSWMTEYKLQSSPYCAFLFIMRQLSSYEDVRDSIMESHRVSGATAV